MVLSFESAAELLFCHNETNRQRVFGNGPAGYFKDSFDARVVHGRRDAVDPAASGTKCGGLHELAMAAGETAMVRVRFRPADRTGDAFSDFAAVIGRRRDEADEFYQAVQAGVTDPDGRAVQRQAFAGMLWSKQFYYYDVREWLAGDAPGPPPPSARLTGRNADWQHLRAADIISMPDCWEYPWFASWDLALQSLAFAAIDPEFAKGQILLLLHEWYMHPNAALPAYEWSFSDANPPLQAWAAWRVFEVDRRIHGKPDHDFLKRVFQKLAMNFTWWVNRKDSEGRNIFQGGFLGLDNIGLFDRWAPLPTGGSLSQSDGTAWMAMYALDLLRMAAELALLDPSYEEMATKFFEHFLLIAKADSESGGLWDEEDSFFYDVLVKPDGQKIPRGHRLKKLLDRMLDPAEFLSDFGVRGVSKVHGANPYVFRWDGQVFELDYEPGESRTGLFGGNSNWRGPVWMPINFMLIESLARFDRYYGSDFRVDLPYAAGSTGSLADVAAELSRRLSRLFARDADGRRPVHGDAALLQTDPHFRDHLLFHEYFDGDVGRGLGASHQTGWTGLIALLLANHDHVD